MEERERITEEGKRLEKWRKRRAFARFWLLWLDAEGTVGEGCDAREEVNAKVSKWAGPAIHGRKNNSELPLICD
eukprot:scaffold2534_cov260-Pinguiococcus_pyrenoidosus.AAC.33